MRGLWLAAVLFVGCGYHFGYSLAFGIERLYVPVFVNQTPWRGLEYDLTRGVLKRLRQSGGVELVASSRRADGILYGTITAYSRGVLSETRENQPLEMGVTIRIQLRLVDARTSEVLWSGSVSESQSFLLGSPTTSQPTELLVGEEEAQRLVLERLAERIVYLLEYWENKGESSHERPSRSPRAG